MAGNVTAITARQLKRLQTLWGLFCRQGRLDVKDRVARLGWIGGQIGRQIASCKELTREEAEKAIDALQKHLPADLVKRRRPGREEAYALGMAGRRETNTRLVQPPDARQLERIAALRAKLGWSDDRFEAWMRSRSGPLRGRFEIRTMGDANAVSWAMKRMLKSSEKEEAPK